jgi:hypothetical protein
VRMRFDVLTKYVPNRNRSWDETSTAHVPYIRAVQSIDKMRVVLEAGERLAKD